MNAIIDRALRENTESGRPVAMDISAPTIDKLNRPLKDLRLSVIDQCNFRCTYCMPRDIFDADYPFMPSAERLSFEQLEKIAQAFARLGVEKIRITGGEPLLRRGLEFLIERLARIETTTGKPMELALTTNGSLLAAKARSLRDAGLDRVTVSLDAIDSDVFRRMSDVEMPVGRILQGIEAAQAVGFAPVKVNTVVERGVNDNQILPLVNQFKGTGVTVRFIEYMDVGGAYAWSNATVLTARETREIVESQFPLVPITRHDRTATAEVYRHADGTGEIGFIASVSEPFCGSCSRARVSADGQLYTCLFATQGKSLKPWLADSASVDEFAAAVRDKWIDRDDRYSELRTIRREQRSGKIYPSVRMSLVGG